MSKRRTYLYRCPDGTVAEDKDEWARSWSALADLIGPMFPGYVVFGMDPGLSFRTVDPERQGSFSLPLGACLSLLESRKGKGPL